MFQGNGVKQDIKKAKQLFKKSCDKGFKEGCSNNKLLDNYKR